MAEKIAIQIELDGGKEVEQQLAAIGNAGAKSLEQIGAAGDQANAGITKTGEAAEKAAGSTSKLSLESVKTAAEIAKLGAEIGLTGVEIVQAVRHHETLIQSLLKLVSGANTATKALGLIAPELAVVGAGALALAGPIAAAVTGFEALEKIATKIAGSTEKLNHTLQTLAATSGESFGKLQVGEAAFDQIGISAETFRSTIAKVQETLAGTEVTNLTKGMKDIVALVNQIAAGDKGITFAGWVTAEDKIKGVSIAMKQAADSGKNATQVLLEFLRSADLATAIKVGAAFGLSDADVDRVRRLDGSISDLIQRIQGAGPLISPAAAAAFERMRTSIQNADSAWVRFKQSLDSTVFSTIAANFSATMNDMKAAAFNAAASISERMNTAFSGMGAQAATDLGDLKAALQSIGATNFFQQMGTDAQNAVAGANAAIAAFVGAVMRGMGASEQAIKGVQDQINGVAPAAAAAGQAVEQTGVMFTSFGTLAEQGANTARAGVEQATITFTSFGTVAAQNGDKAKAAMEQASGPTQSLSDKVGEIASKIAGITWDAISSTGVAAWNALTAAIQNAINKLLEFIGLKPSAPATGGGAPGKASGGMIGGLGTGTSDSNLAWLSRGEHIMPAHVVRQPGVLSLLEALRRGAALPGFAAGGAVGGGYTIVAEGAFDQTLMSVAEKLQQIIDSLRQVQFEILQAGRNRSGGLLGGRGNGTSDSNLAWVSRGEYITPARAVGQPGVLAFLEALRRSGGNLSRALDGMGRFALGGMVPGRMAIPAFASGGLAGGSNVTIQFPGLPAISGLRASSDVVDQLHRAAALAQVRSGGRKPSRYS